MDVEWDKEKAQSNDKKHDVSFFEATEVFADELSSTVSDPDSSEGEYRYLIFGRTLTGRSLVVSYTERNERIRIISARPMTKRERKAYEQ